MKKLIVIAIFAFGMNALAQEKSNHDKNERPKMETLTPEQRNQLHVKKLTLELGLNTAQQKEMAAILKDAEQRREAAKAERKALKDSGKERTAEDRFAMQNKRLDEQIAMKEKVKKVLTSEQFGKWEKLNEDRKHNFKDRLSNKRGRDRK